MQSRQKSIFLEAGERKLAFSSLTADILHKQSEEAQLQERVLAMNIAQLQEQIQEDEAAKAEAEQRRQKQAERQGALRELQRGGQEQRLFNIKVFIQHLKESLALDQAQLDNAERQLAEAQVGLLEEFQGRRASL
jgi:hypothetical protein